VKHDEAIPCTGRAISTSKIILLALVSCQFPPALFPLAQRTAMYIRYVLRILQLWAVSTLNGE
jgi:hypothetical protein